MVQMISESKRRIAALALAGAMAIGGAAGVATTMASPAQNQSGIVMEAEAENYDPYAYPEFTYNVWYDYVRLTVRNGNHNYQIAPGTQIIVDGGWTKDTKSKITIKSGLRNGELPICGGFVLNKKLKAHTITVKFANGNTRTKTFYKAF